jgi:dinuclear metal center YbgI/SA1388 family protein
MERLAPLELSEAWDNTGLLLGDRLSPVERVMTCLTLTPDSVSEAIAGGAQLVIAHHPLPFKPLSRITTDSYVGRLLWRLATAGIAIYSPHTAWDSARRGINARLAELLSLENCRPLIVADPERWPGAGSGRMGELAQPLDVEDISRKLSQVLPGCRPRGVDVRDDDVRDDDVRDDDVRDDDVRADPLKVRSVAIACGSGGSLLAAAVAHGCELFVTGEGTFHLCLEAQAAGIALLMIGHFASERFAMEQLATELSGEFPDLRVWASRNERDPVRNLS